MSYVIAQKGTDLSVKKLRPFELTNKVSEAKSFTRKKDTKPIVEKLGKEYRASKPL